MKLYRPFVAIMIALLLLVSSLGFIGSLQPAEAAPNLAPTIFTLSARNNAITTTYTSDPVDVSAFDTLFFQYDIDNPDTNPVTVTLQHSVNGWAYVSHTVVVTDSSADDDSAVSKLTDFGRYVRVVVAPDASDTITPSVMLLATGSR